MEPAPKFPIPSTQVPSTPGEAHDPTDSLAISRRFLQQVFSRASVPEQSGSLPGFFPGVVAQERVSTGPLPAHPSFFPTPSSSLVQTDATSRGDISLEGLLRSLPAAVPGTVPAPIQQAIDAASQAAVLSATPTTPVPSLYQATPASQPPTTQGGIAAPAGDDLGRVLNEIQSHSREQIQGKLGNSSLIETRSTSGSSIAAKPLYKPTHGTGHSYRPFNVDGIRADFPALNQTINGHPMVWFDNAATTQKPQVVIDALASFYAHDYSNIHRAAHSMAARATDHYEAAREAVRDFIRAESVNDIVFVRGTTEGINLIANTCKSFLREGDEILLTEMEHHANIVPWQMVAHEKRARIRIVPFEDNGEISLDSYRRLLSPRVKMVSLTHASNTLGTVLPVALMTQMAHQHGARVVVDGAQSIAHMPIDVRSLGCDYFVFSGHKIFAPTGIGVVYMHPELQDMLPPWQGGGNMIHRVSFDETIYADAPAKFEAGTPSIGDAIGLGAALRYLQQFDPISIQAHEHALLEFASYELSKITGLTIYGHAREKVGLVSFTLDGYTTEQVGKELDRYGIEVRTGHHCAQPSLRHYGLESTVRPSFALYNTHEEIERLVDVVQHLSKKR
jgi:cysteine desulfurase/selenocysteine lyase